jgi:adenylate cyclase
VRDIAIGVGITLVCAAIHWFQPQPVVNLDRRVFDLFANWAGRGRPSDRVSIVEIDEASLARYGRWPWPRERIAMLITSLFDHGAATVALDMMFPEPDGGDAALVSAIQGKKVIVGYQLTFDPNRSNLVDCKLHPSLFAGAAPQAFRGTAALCSRPEIANAAAATGFLNAAPDPDGLLRRIPLLAEYEGRVYPSLALAAFLVYSPSSAIAWKPQRSGNQSLLLGGRTVLLDARAGLLVRFRGPARTLRFISAADVLAQQVSEGDLRGKLVIVGGSAIGLQEIVPTPVGPRFPGPEVQATVLDNLLQGDFLGLPPGGWLIQSMALLVAGFASAILFQAIRLRWALAIAAVVVGLAWIASFQIFSRTGSFFSPLPIAVVLCSNLGVLIPLQLVSERRRAADEASCRLAAAREFMVQSLASLAAIRDLETGEHLLRTQHYTRLLCEAAQIHPQFRDFLTPETIELLVQLVPLHDIGKVAVPDYILHKPGRLTAEEYEKVKLHVEHGKQVLETARVRSGIEDRNLFRIAVDIVYAHHEHWDGTGYPRQLAGKRIPIPGRMMALADVYDALVSKRVYKKRMSHQDAMAIIQAGSGTHFDPDLVEAFLRTHERWSQVAQEFDEDRATGATAAR